MKHFRTVRVLEYYNNSNWKWEPIRIVSVLEDYNLKWKIIII